MSKNNIFGGHQLMDARGVLEKYLKMTAGAQVADFGCGGSGYFTFVASELVGERGKVYAVDVVKGILKSVENRAKMMGYNNVVPVWTNLEKFGAAKINDSSMDFVLIVNVLFQSKEHGKIFREMVRVMKRGSKALVIDWKKGRFPLGPPPEMRINPDDLGNVALGAGLKKIRDAEVGKYHFGIVFERI